MNESMECVRSHRRGKCGRCLCHCRRIGINGMVLVGVQAGVDADGQEAVCYAQINVS